MATKTAGNGTPARPRKAPAKAAPKPAAAAPESAPLVPATPPVRIEIRIDGAIRFANFVYNPTLVSEDGTVTLTGSLEPTMVAAPPVRPPVQFFDDARNGEEIITQVHSGRRI